MIVAKTKDIDGIKTVIGLSELQVDPVETEKAIKEDYQKSSEFQALAVRLTKIRSYTMAITKLDYSDHRIKLRAADRTNVHFLDVMENHFLPPELEKMGDNEKLKKIHRATIKSIESELPEVDINLQKKRIALIKSGGVYFDPGKDDVILTDLQVTDFKGKLIKLGKKQFLTLAGEVVDDHRNRTTYFKNTDKTWNIKRIMILGEKIDSLSVFSEDLTNAARQEVAEYQETVRIAGLSIADKTLELESMRDSLAGQAAHMRNKLEIQGDKDALTKSQDWYNAEVLALEDKYK